MPKPFDAWNEKMKALDATHPRVFAHQREIWWCSLGVNIGVETDGKNKDFERPVVIMRVYNLDAVLVLPITSKKGDNRFHFRSETKSRGQLWIKLTQARVVSVKRLTRKVDVIHEDAFIVLQKRFREFT